MRKEDIELLYKYDRWANQQVLESASALSAEQFTRDLGGSFRSVRDAIVHIIGGEWGWLTYWNARTPSAEFLNDVWDRQYGSVFRPDLFPDLAAVRAKWAEVEKEQMEFVDAATEETLTKSFPVGAKQISLANLMQHMANHSTYHRGQAALMMGQVGVKPLATDFCDFLLRG